MKRKKNNNNNNKRKEKCKIENINNFSLRLKMYYTDFYYISSNVL